jgi:hypothetical protein
MGAGRSKDSLGERPVRQQLLPCAAAFFAFTSVSAAQAPQKKYETPPSDVTSRNVPYISDAEMERCVVLYNEAKWLSEEIDRTPVDQYSKSSVDAYNAKVTRHGAMIDSFNARCAGKQSESAYRAAQKLNQKKAK